MDVNSPYQGMNLEQLQAAVTELAAQNTKLASLTPGPSVVVGEYKGHKTLTITPKNARPFNIGVAKVNHIIEMYDLIEKALAT